jgi:hypothetical protein
MDLRAMMRHSPSAATAPSAERTWLGQALDTALTVMRKAAEEECPLSPAAARHIETCVRLGDPISSADTPQYREEAAGLGAIGKEYPKDHTERRTLEVQYGQCAPRQELRPLWGEQVLMILDGAKRCDRDFEPVFVKGKSGSPPFFGMLELRRTDSATIVTELTRLVRVAQDDHGMTVFAFETDNASNFTAALGGMAKDGSLSQALGASLLHLKCGAHSLWLGEEEYAKNDKVREDDDGEPCETSGEKKKWLERVGVPSSQRRPAADHL